MSGPRLTELNEIISQWELDGLGEKLDQAFDSDRQEGKLAGEKVSQAITEHRAQHPYDR